MTKIKIEIDTNALGEAISKIVHASPSSFLRNPVASAIVEALEDNHNVIREKMRLFVLDFINNPALEKTVKETLRTALSQEAQKIGTRIARQIANSDNTTTKST